MVRVPIISSATLELRLFLWNKSSDGMSHCHEFSNTAMLFVRYCASIDAAVNIIILLRSTRLIREV